MQLRMLIASILALSVNAAVHGEEQLVYKTVGDQKLNLYVDKPQDWNAADRRPAVVFYFGGGWVGGSPAQFEKQSQYLATRGLVGIRVRYRTIDRSKPGLPEICCADAKSAMRYVRKHAAQLGIDPGRIAAAGGSAGGHLASFTAMVPGLDDPADDTSVSCRPDALVLFNPVFNNGPGEWGHNRVGDRYKEFSPAHNIAGTAPPTIVFLGDMDKLISVDVLNRFRDDMKAAGVRCDTRVYEGAGHGFFNNDPYFTETLIETDKFLNSLGWITGPPTISPVPEPATTSKTDPQAKSARKKKSDRQKKSE
ncbi:MAG: alpha/beta hydrolase [Planctomycetaceae bacterium]|nr:alpha/beta hydrolase [Planctomycetaceae bacterium]